MRDTPRRSTQVLVEERQRRSRSRKKGGEERRRDNRTHLSCTEKSSPTSSSSQSSSHSESSALAPSAPLPFVAPPADPAVNFAPYVSLTSQSVCVDWCQNSEGSGERADGRRRTFSGELLELVVLLQREKVGVGGVRRGLRCWCLCSSGRTGGGGGGHDLGVGGGGGGCREGLVLLRRACQLDL